MRNFVLFVITHKTSEKQTNEIDIQGVNKLMWKHYHLLFLGTHISVFVEQTLPC